MADLKIQTDIQARYDSLLSAGKELDKIDKTASTLSKKKINITSSITEKGTTIKQIQNDIAKLEAKKDRYITLIAKDNNTVSKLKKQVDDLEKTKLDIDVSTKKGLVEVQKLDKTIEQIKKRIDKAEMRVIARTDTVEADTEKIKTKIEREKQVQLKVEAEQESLNKLNSQIAKLDAEKITIDADVKLNDEYINSLRGKFAKFGNDYSQAFSQGFTSTKTMLDSVGGSVQSLGTKMTVVGGIGTAVFGTQIKNVLKDALFAYSDLNEAQNKFNMLVGDQSTADSFKGSLDEINKKLYYSEQELYDTASAYYSMAKAQDISEEGAQGMTESLVALTRDAGSFYNVTEKELVPAIRSIFTGETEAMMGRFGVSMHVSQMESYLLKKGLAGSKEEATELWKSMDKGEQSQIRFKYFAETMSNLNVNDDFQRTLAFSLPNQIKVIQSEWNKFQVKLGEKISPKIIPLTTALMNLGTTVNNLSDSDWDSILNGLLGMGKALITITTVGAGLTLVGTGVKLLSAPIAGLSASFTGLSAGLGAVLPNATTLTSVLGNIGKILPFVALPMGLVTLATTGLVLGLGALNKSMGDVRFDKMIQDVSDLAKGFSDNLMNSLTNINDMLSNIDVGKMVDSIGKILSSIDWMGIFSELVKVISNVVDITLKTFAKINWIELLTKGLSGAISIFVSQTSVATKTIIGLVATFKALQGIDKGLKMFDTVRKSIGGVAESSELLAKVLPTVSKGMGTAGTATSSLATGLTGATSMMGALLSPMGLAIIGVTALVAGIIAYNIAQDNMKNKQSAIAKAMTETSVRIGSVKTSFDELSSKSIPDINKKFDELDKDLASMKFELPTDGLEAFKTKSDEAFTAVSTSLKENNTLMYTQLQDWYTKNDGVIDEGERNHLETILKYGVDEQNSVKSKQDAITAIIQKAVDEKRALNEQERADIQAHQLAMRQMAMTQLTDSGAEELAIRKRITGQINSVNDEAFKKWSELQDTSQQERLASQDVYYGTVMDAENRSHEQKLATLQVGTAQYDAEVLRHQTAVTDITASATLERQKVIQDDAVKTVDIVTGGNAKQVLEYQKLSKLRHQAYLDGDTAQFNMLTNLMKATGVTQEQSDLAGQAYKSMSEEEKRAWDKMVADTNMSVEAQVSKLNEMESKAPESMRKATKGMTWAVVDGKAEVVDAFGNVVTDAKARADFESNTYSIGNNLVAGIRNGITGNAWTIGVALANAVIAGKQAGEKAGEIHSPSRLTARDIGQWMPKGVAMGIDDNADSIEDSMAEAVFGAKNKLSSMDLQSQFALKLQNTPMKQGIINQQGNTQTKNTSFGGVVFNINNATQNTAQEIKNVLNEMGLSI